MIAITGVPGVGKTYTIKLLKERGYKVLISDEFFTHEYQKGQNGYKLIKKHLGNEYINKSHVLKIKLREYASKNLEKLEKLVHPLLEEHFKKNKYDFVEIPIINSKFANFNNFFLITINIINSERIIKKRLLKREMNKNLHSLIIKRMNKKNRLKKYNVYSGDIKEIINIMEIN